LGFRLSDLVCIIANKGGLMIHVLRIPPPDQKP
jgi:hypothetical protein